MASWATPEQAKAHWADAASLPPETLQTLLDVATEQCEVYAPVLPVVDPPPDPPAPLPSRYVQACIYQAREVYAAGQRDGDIIGLGDYAIRARPLTSTVKSLLRPQPGVPAVG